MEITNEHLQAIELFEGDNQLIFLTGDAGTGKSTLVSHWLTKTSRKVVKLAPTGLAALNISGQTIHSFFKIDPNESPAHLGTLKPLNDKFFESFDTIIIDEISMVRADIMFVINSILSMYNGLPFGGKKIICIGDMCQLPPVVKEDELAMLLKTFNGVYWQYGLPDITAIKKIELTKIFRQTDSEFTELLNNVRNNRNVPLTVLKLNKTAFKKKPHEFAVFACSTNKAADEKNNVELDKIAEKLYTFEGKEFGNIGKDKPAPLVLKIKVGAKVMFCTNTPNFVNGEMGFVKEIKDKEGIIVVEKSNGERIDVTRHTWSPVKYEIELNEEGELVLLPKKTSFFTQFPLKIAYAMTIHKSQGQTFEAIHIEMGNGAFAHGLTYVALSRCKSLENMSFARPLKNEDVSRHYDLKAFIV